MQAMLKHVAQGAPPVAVMGGGLPALASAHYLLGAGFQPLLADCAPPDPLSARIELGDRSHDTFHLSLGARDSATTGMLADLGALHRLRWRPHEVAVFDRGALRDRPSVRPHLLGLRWPARTRGAATAIDWLHARFGTAWSSAYWVPLLERQLGRPLADAPVAWVADAVEQWKKERTRFGHLQGGLRGLEELLRSSLALRGARFCAVEELARRAAGAQVCAVLGARTIGRELGAGHERGAILTSVIATGWSSTRAPYATLCADPSLAFQWVFDGAAAGDRGEDAPVYLTHRGDGLPTQADDVWIKQAEEALLALGFRRSPWGARFAIRRVALAAGSAVPMKTEARIESGRPPHFRLSAESTPSVSPIEATIVAARETAARIRSHISAQ